MGLVEGNEKYCFAQKLAKLTFAIVKFYNFHETVFANEFGLTIAEFRFLRLFEGKGELELKYIVSELKISPGRITHILTSLEKKKLIVRISKPTDRRNVIVKLNERSKRILKNFSDFHIKKHQSLLEKMSENDHEVLITAADKILMELSIS